MKLSAELEARGFIHQTTSELSHIVDGEKRTVYHGIDPSADSAHAGNFVQWVLLRHLALAGHKIIFLVGGATGRIGDPKPDAERTLLPEEVIENNVAKIKAQAEAFIGIGEITFVNNYDWFQNINFIDFLRDIGKHFTVNELLKKDAIATRVASDVGLSYTEFAYPLLQGYDFLELYRTYGCDVQIGGSDQWGNIVAGVDLVRRKEQATVYAITQPLVVDKSTGQKFGKSEGNAVWLDAEKTSPYQFYQFWLNVADENVIEYLKRFSFIALEEITELENQQLAAPAERVAQKCLAAAVTSLVHGEAAADAAAEVSTVLFGGQKLQQVSVSAQEMILETAPTCVTRTGEAVVEVLIKAELASSKRAAREFIENGAVSIDGERVEDSAAVVGESKLQLLRRGKKQLCVLRVEL